MDNKTIGLFIGAIILVVVAAYGISTLNNDQAPENIVTNNNEPDVVTNERKDNSDTGTTEETNLDDTRRGEEDVVVLDNTDNDVLPDEIEVVVEEEVSSGSYVTYDENLIRNASTGDVVLFFHATWCPSCRTLDSDIRSSLSEIPSGLTILQTDYDSNTELRRKYGVTTQHTIVQVDAQGNLIKKWSGGSDLDSIVSEVQ